MADGILLVDKPAGWTSMDVCAKLRGILQTRRIGHAGTLDPMATGVLPVFAGQATRAVSFAEGGEKIYEAVLRLGTVTDTQDTSGTVLAQHAVSVTPAQLEDVLSRFRGEIDQIPPMYSAIKINGQKLYDLARKGREVSRQPRRITVFALELTQQLSPTDFALRIHCSKGTYVRTLCHDIGAALGCGGCMASLRRTMAAGFYLKDCHTLSQIEAEGAALLLPVDSLFSAYGAYRIASPRQEQLCRNGNPFSAEGEEGVYRVYGADGTFLCLSRLENGVMTSLKNFFGA